MSSAQTHDLMFSESEVKKRFASWERGEPDREWSCLTLLAVHAPGLAPTPLRRETGPDGAPVIVMTRLPGRPLGDTPLTAVQTRSLGQALRRTYDVPFEAVLEADIGDRLYGPSTLPEAVLGWLREERDVSQCDDPSIVRRGIDEAVRFLAEPAALPEPRLSVIGISDRKPANILWDGQTCRLVDFEDSGQSDPAYELADQVEHIAVRLVDLVDPRALFDAVELSCDERERVHAYRPLWASFWLAMLLPGSGGFHRNPPGTTEDQARHLLGLIG